MTGIHPRLMRLGTVGALSIVIAVFSALATPAAPGQAAGCAFSNRTPAAGSTVADTTPIIAVNFTCPQPITNVTMTLDGGAQAPHVAGPSSTQQSTFYEPPTPLAAGAHTVRITVTSGTSEFVEWSFNIPSMNPCGPATPSGGTYPASGLAFVVWLGTTPCLPAAAATNIGLGSGITMTGLWYLDHWAGLWRYYLPTTASGTLTTLPTTTALAAILS